MPQVWTALICCLRFAIQVHVSYRIPICGCMVVDFARVSCWQVIKQYRATAQLGMSVGLSKNCLGKHNITMIICLIGRLKELPLEYLFAKADYNSIIQIDPMIIFTISQSGIIARKVKFIVQYRNNIKCRIPFARSVKCNTNFYHISSVEHMPIFSFAAQVPVY